jgi:riboflavin kinase/FMN adenylyltransferase
VRIIEWNDFIAGKAPPIPEEPPLSLSIGVFDGVHRGHQELVRRIVAQSPASTVITFRQNPKQVLSPEKYHGDIFSLNQKLSILEALGLRQAVLIDFSGNFSRLTGREFIGLLKKSRRIAYMALGVNFRCGCRLDTGARSIRTWMAEEGIVADLVEPVMEGRHPVSSSRIRTAISAGDLALATALLGRNVRLDLSGLRVSVAGEGRRYDAASAFRVTPRTGRYRALAYGAAGGEGIPGEVSIQDGLVFVPGKPGESAFCAESLEFIEPV